MCHLRSINGCQHIRIILLLFVFSHRPSERHANIEAYEIGRDRFEDSVDQALPIDEGELRTWMEHARTSSMAGDGGFPIGSKLLNLLEEEEGHSDGLHLWNVLRGLVAAALDQSIHRAARNIDVHILAAAIHVIWASIFQPGPAKLVWASSGLLL